MVINGFTHTHTVLVKGNVLILPQEKKYIYIHIYFPFVFYRLSLRQLGVEHIHIR